MIIIKAELRQLFSACVYVGWFNQGKYFENATACSKRMLKMRVATQLKAQFYKQNFVTEIPATYNYTQTSQIDEIAVIREGKKTKS
jgi:hypothetical protein